MRNGLLALALAASSGLAEAQAAAPLQRADAALQAGAADQARTLLAPLLRPGQSQAPAQNLYCRVLYTLEQWDGAAEACQTAVNLESGNSRYQLWLGRALGEKASHASFLSAYTLAKRVRAAFEEAVRLNPRDTEALADLAEFYVSAPSIIGGGMAKAENVAAQLDRIDPVRAHELRGRIAQERKDYGMAEREYKQALASSAHPAYQWTTLASLYRRTQRWNDLDAAVHAAMAAAAKDKPAGVALSDAASSLIAANRDPQFAIKLLETYLSGPTTEEAPVFQARTRLAHLRMKLGDQAGAQREQAEALALAHDYRPAQDLNAPENK